MNLVGRAVDAAFRSTAVIWWKGKRLKELRAGSPDLREEVHRSDEYIFFGPE